MLWGCSLCSSDVVFFLLHVSLWGRCFITSSPGPGASWRASHQTSLCWAPTRSGRDGAHGTSQVFRRQFCLDTPVIVDVSHERAQLPVNEQCILRNLKTCEWQDDPSLNYSKQAIHTFISPCQSIQVRIKCSMGQYFITSCEDVSSFRNRHDHSLCFSVSVLEGLFSQCSPASHKTKWEHPTQKVNILATGLQLICPSPCHWALALRLVC